MKMFFPQHLRENHYFTVSKSINYNYFLLATTKLVTIDISDENDVVSNYFLRKEKRNGLLAVFNGIKESVLPTRNKKAF